jgi:O-antigen biosynthesis protein
LRLTDARPRLSLCMIVRDSARTLPAGLESIRPWVDEMVIVDTGSVDETPRIVESYGGRRFHFPWCDDFSAARNESLRYARGEWLFWMDSDDTIPPECGRRLRRLIDGPADPRVLGFVMQVHCRGGGECDPDITVVDHVKLFRNRPDLRFDGRIHEQVLPAIRRLGVSQPGDALAPHPAVRRGRAGLPAVAPVPRLLPGHVSQPRLCAEGLGAAE